MRGQIRSVVLVVTVLVASLLPSASASGQTSPAFPSDDFARADLGAAWSVVDPVGDGAVTMVGAGTGDARLELSVPAGVRHDPWNTNRALRVMRSSADADFTAIVKLESVPTQKYQMQGLLVQQDGDDWLRFNTHHDGSSLRAYAASTTAGMSTSRVNRAAPAGGAPYLRVARAGDTWTFSTSADGSTWTTAGSFTHALDVSAVGPFAGNANTSAASIPAHTAVVDYVFEASAPIDLEDTPDPGTTPPANAGPTVDLFYGDRQPAGTRGQPQTAYNLLGNVSDPDGVAALSYTLNGGPSRALTIGPNSRRLQLPGDFNADIAYADLVPGDNTVTLTARDALGNLTTSVVHLDRQAGSAPLPYATDWAGAGAIGDDAQVVDGRWRLDGDTVRPVELGYDRVVAVGDLSWRDYEMTVAVTPLELGPGAGSPLSGPALLGFGLNWRGHTQAGSEQPPYHWYPTGALGWYRWYGTPRFELRGNGDQPVVRHQRSQLAFGQTYVFKARSETVPGGVRYSWKVWPQGSAEPATWDLTLVEDSGPATGSVILIAHHVDAHFGDVTVTPIP